MAIKLNSNLASLNAQRSLSDATKKLSDSFTRLSSGLRINKSSDDAAGLSISESLKADTRILNQGIRNLNDGVSLLNIADGALGELSNIAIRLNELAQQSANGTFAYRQRAALDQEAQSLSKEYNRIARTTEFNGRKLFDGDFGKLSLAAGGSTSSLIVNGLGGAIGDGSFKATVSVSTGVNPEQSNVGDFNGDGTLDMVVVDSSDIIKFMMGKGDGTFTQGQTLNVSLENWNIRLADFNNDGILDVVTAGGTSANIDVFIGNGNGTFKSKTTYRTSNSTTGFVIGDVNNDGITDVIAGPNEVLFGNGDGSFKGFASLGLTAGSVTGATDLNNDGIVDLVVVDGAFNRVQIHLGNGNGTFQAQRSYVVGTGGSRSKTVDLNNDGFLDIITNDIGSNELSLLLGNGDGTFQARRSLAMNGGVTDFAVGDFNGDSFVDIVTIDGLNNSVGLFNGNGNGTFSGKITVGVGGLRSSIHSADANNDGVLDLLAAGNGMSTIGVLIGNSNEGISALQSFSLKTQADARQSMTYLKSTLNRLSEQRGHVGAFQSRIDTAVSNLKQNSLAYSEANSRIVDTDVAEESSKLVANGILQKSASSVLAQANQQPRIVLKLLEGI